MKIDKTIEKYLGEATKMSVANQMIKDPDEWVSLFGKKVEKLLKAKNNDGMDKLIDQMTDKNADLDKDDIKTMIKWGTMLKKAK